MMKIGIVGAGKISEIYLKNISGMFKNILCVTAISDLVYEKAEELCQRYKIKNKPFVNFVDLITCPDVDLVLNLTQPLDHYSVSFATVNMGKHLYSEKPLCVDKNDAKKILNEAKKNNVFVGSAPDTFLGAGIQTCRKLIDDNWIGRPLASVAFMMNHGHESWHPSPEFYYKRGGGPLLDMGPYYLTALIYLLGPVKRVSGSARSYFKTRTITSNPFTGSVINVEVPTHVTATLDFSSGVLGTIITSFDVWSHTLPSIEIYGSEGTIRVPDPNTFGGKVYIKRGTEENWSEIPLIGNFSDDSRGIGIAEMSEAIYKSRIPRASGELAYHVLDIMQDIYRSSETGQYCDVQSTCTIPDLLPLGVNDENAD